MPGSSSPALLRSGLLAAAATAGVLAGFGTRFGSPWFFFQVYGREVVRVLTGALPSPSAAAAAGAVGHFVTMLLWATVYRLLLGALAPRRLAGVVGVTLSVCVLAALIQLHFLPLAAGAGSAQWLGTPRQSLYLLVLGVALLAGTRLAERS
ncbi:MAG TPA: hypothetical protein VNL96_08670 [Gemmatimonadaceae bacterium]|nr:hypothetical protein [Gemmatimonadaceae bacterium]